MRGWLRRWLRRCGLLGALLIVVGLLATLTASLYGRHLRQKALDEVVRLGGSLDLAKLEKTVPFAENAGAQLHAAAKAIRWSEEDKWTRDRLFKKPVCVWGAERMQSARILLKRHGKSLQALHVAATLPRSSYGIPYRQGVNAEIPHLIHLMRSSKLLLIQARVAFADGNVAVGIKALQAVSRIISTLEAESTLITAMIARLVDSFLMIFLAELVSSDQPMTPGLLDQLEAVVPNRNPTEEARRLFLAEIAAIGVVRQRNPQRPIRDLFMGDLDVARSLELMLDSFRRIGTPYGTAQGEFHIGKNEQPDEYVGSPDKYSVLMQAMSARRLLVRAGLAMRKIGLASGRYPETRPSSVSELNEPDPFTGNILRYELLSSGALRIRSEGAKELFWDIIPSQDEWVILLPAIPTSQPASRPASSNTP
jgi:hypothetical protein